MNIVIKLVTQIFLLSKRFSSHGILCFVCCARSQCDCDMVACDVSRIKAFKTSVRERERMWMKGKMMLFAAFMCKLYDVIIIRKMSSSRKSIFYFSPGFHAQNVSTWCVWYFSVHFMFSWKLALSLSLSLFISVSFLLLVV